MVLAVACNVAYLIQTTWLHLPNFFFQKKKGLKRFHMKCSGLRYMIHLENAAISASYESDNGIGIMVWYENFKLINSLFLDWKPL